MKEDFEKKYYTQEDLDKALHEGYRVAEEQYSKQIKDLKNKIKEGQNGKGTD